MANGHELANLVSRVLIGYLTNSVGCRLVQLGEREAARPFLDRAEQVFERLGDDQGVEIARPWRDGDVNE